MHRNRRSEWLLLMFTFWTAWMTGCTAEPSMGSAQLVVTVPQALGTSDVTRVELKVSGPGMTPRTESLSRSGAQWSGLLSQLPVGAGRSFEAKAYDSSNTQRYAGQTTGVIIETRKTSIVTLLLQQVDAPPDFTNAAPVITALVANPGLVEPGGQVDLYATAVDPNSGDTLTYAWTAAAGTFDSAITAATRWTAPAQEGPVSLSLKVTDSKGATAVLGFTLTVGGATGQAAVNVTFNTWPQVKSMAASPSAVNVGETTEVTVASQDLDGDAPGYQWSSGCTGTWTNATTATARFTPTVQPAAGALCAACTLSVNVTDGRGGQTTGSLTVCVGPKAGVRFAPQVVETFQSSTTLPDNRIVSLRVKAADAQASALSFTWAASEGSLATPVSTADTSEVRWTAPACSSVGVNATITMTVTNALGLAATRSFGVTGNTACDDPASSRAQLAGGWSHSLALKGGKVYGWGSNRYGQLGQGEPLIQQIPGLTGVVSLTGGTTNSFALKQDGTVWSWGSGALGESPDPHFSPRQVKGVSGITSLAASQHVLALAQDGSLWAWGNNHYGQLGDGATNYGRSAPVLISGLTAVRAVSVSRFHSLAVRQDGTVWAWGYNAFGELGNGTTDNSAVPIQVQGLTDVIAVQAGSSFSLALKQDGTVWAWGINSSGQLGDGSYDYSRPLPGPVPGLTGVTALAAGERHVAALTQDGAVWTWGPLDMLGTGSSDYGSARTPVKMTSFTKKVTSITSRYRHTAAVLEDGTLWMWGDNSYGQLGDGTALPRFLPTQVPGFMAFQAAAGDGHTLAVKTDGTVWSWGSNDDGQLGDGSARSWVAPVPMQGLAGVIAIASGGDHSVALRQDGTVWTCGRNNFGQLGHGTLFLRSAPTQVQGLSNITSVAANAGQTFALRDDGTVWAWGDNTYGQLGDGSTSNRLTPVQVRNLTSVIAISAQHSHTLALKQDGTVWAWGRNLHGEVDGTGTQRTVPIQVQGLSSVKAIVASGAHSLVLLLDGTVWMWGKDFADVTHPAPVQVQGISGVSALTASSRHVVAARQDGTLWAWGAEDSLGDGGYGYGYVNQPVRVKDLTGVSVLAAANFHTLAMKPDGTLWGWGNNVHGQLGSGISGVKPAQLTDLPSP